MGIAVVQDGKVVLVKGYGYRDLEKKLPVTPKTLFAVGSITKSFTVTLLGMLVDEGKLDWDKPVHDYLPDFRLFDPVASDHITTRDLVTHRSGLPRHDQLWYTSTFTRAEMVKRLRYLEPSKDFRSTYQYNNLMFMTAGYLAGQLLGTTWEEAVRRRVLGPLGMRDTNLSVVESQKRSDFAQPYKKDKTVVKPMPFYILDAVAPAGAVNSCAEDLSKYLLFQLNRGKIGDIQVLSEDNAVQMQTPQMAIQAAPQFPEQGASSYGLGLGISTYRGHKIVSHGGAIDGFTSQFAFLPQEKIGVDVLTNLDFDGNSLPGIIAFNVFDRLLGLDPVPWNQRYLDRERKGKQSEREAKGKGYTLRRPGTHPSHDLKEYAGDYANPAYGTVTITLNGVQNGNTFKMSLNRLSSPLRHVHYDVFEVPDDPLDPLEKTKLMFFTDLKGDISSLSIPLEPSVKDIVFTRLPERQMRERSFLEPLTGQYELPGTTMAIALAGEHTLVLSLPGQPSRELLPLHGTAFDVKGTSGFSIEFQKDQSGRVIEAVLYQLEQTLVAKKK